MIVSLLLAVLFVGSVQQPTEGSASVKAWRVEAHLAIEQGATRREKNARYELRLAGDVFGLELGNIRIRGTRHAEGATITAWHTHDPATVFEAQGPDLASLIRQNLPPLWSGPLAVWLTGQEDAFPLVGHSWPAPPRLSPGPPDGAAVVRAALNTTIRITPPGANGVFQEEISIRDQTHRSHLILTYVPVKPPPGKIWNVDSSERTPVSSIRALHPKTPPVQTGHRVPPLRIFSQQGDPVDLRRSFDEQKTSRRARRADALVLIFQRLESTAEALSAHGIGPEDINQIRTNLAIQASAQGLSRPRLIIRPVAVFDVPEYSQDLLDAFAQRWAGIRGDALLEDVEGHISPILWTHPPRESIDLFTPGARMSAVVITPDWRLKSTLRLDESDELETWLMDVLLPEVPIGQPERP